MELLDRVSRGPLFWPVHLMHSLHSNRLSALSVQSTADPGLVTIRENPGTRLKEIFLCGVSPEHAVCFPWEHGPCFYVLAYRCCFVSPAQAVWLLACKQME